jgi:hypothetical protein
VGTNPIERVDLPAGVANCIRPLPGARLHYRPGR